MVTKALGRLIQATGEELSGLAGQAGMDAPPTTPLGAASIGATPDQAKMAGTLPNKLNAIRQSIQSDMTLSTAQRQDKALRTTATEGEVQALYQASQLSNMGSLGQRIVDLAKQYQEQAAAQAIQSLSADIKVDSFPADKQAKAGELLNKIKTSTGQDTLDALRELAELKGVTFGAGFDPVTFAQTFFKTLTPEELSKRIKDAMSDKSIEFKDISDEALQLAGITTNRAEIAAALGTTPEALANMKYADIKDAFDRITRENYSNVDELQNILKDPRASAADKLEAHRRLRELGVVGIRTTEEKVNDIRKQIEDGDTVMVAGKMIRVDELLSNETAQYLIDQALKDPMVLAELKKTQPELADYIEKNRNALKTLSDSLSPQIKEFNAIQAYNKSLAGSLPEHLAKKYIPGYGEIRSSRLQPPNNIVKYLNDPQLPKEKRQAIESALMTASNYPDLENFFVGASVDELQRIGFLDNPQEYLTSYTTRLAERDAIDSITTMEALLSFLYPGEDGTSLLGYINRVQNDPDRGNNSAWASFLQGNPIFDSNGDGVLDDVRQIKITLKSQLTPGVLATNATNSNLVKRGGGLDRLNNAVATQLQQEAERQRRAEEAARQQERDKYYGDSTQSLDTTNQTLTKVMSSTVDSETKLTQMNSLKTTYVDKRNQYIQQIDAYRTQLDPNSDEYKKWTDLKTRIEGEITNFNQLLNQVKYDASRRKQPAWVNH